MSIFRLALGCVGSLALLCASALARAETLVLLTENLVPFNMAVNGGNSPRTMASAASAPIPCAPPASARRSSAS